MPQQRLPTMPKHHPRARLLLQRANHLMTPNPIIMIPRQPTLRLIGPEILPHMILIRSADPGTRFRHVDLHDTEPGRVAGTVYHVYAWGDLEERAVEGLPV